MCFLCWKRCGPEITDRKQNRSSVYLLMWQGNSIFFFHIVPPGLLYEFLIFVSHWEISLSCDIPVENTQWSQRAGLWKNVLLLIWSNPIATFRPASLLNCGFVFYCINIKGILHPRILVLCLQTASSYVSCIFFFSNGLDDNLRMTINWLLAVVIIMIIQYFLIMLLLHKCLFNDSDQAVIKVVKLVTLINLDLHFNDLICDL